MKAWDLGCREGRDVRSEFDGFFLLLESLALATLVDVSRVDICKNVISWRRRGRVCEMFSPA